MSQENKKNKTILVIEDDLALLDAIKTKLELCGFDVIVSRSVERAFTTEFDENHSDKISKSSIETALAHLASLEEVDAIWLDHNLIGDEDGLDFVVKFKANGGKWTSLPIFVVSNSGNPDLIHTYAQLGVTHYYLKAEHKLADIISDIDNVISSVTA